MLPEWFFTRWEKPKWIIRPTLMEVTPPPPNKSTNLSADMTFLLENVKLNAPTPTWRSPEAPPLLYCCRLNRSTESLVHRVLLLISASVLLAVRSSPGRTVWRAEAGWSCPHGSPSPSDSKPSGSNLTTLPLKGLGRPWLILPGTIEAIGTERSLQPPLPHIRHKTGVRLPEWVWWSDEGVSWWEVDTAGVSSSFSKYKSV